MPEQIAFMVPIAAIFLGMVALVLTFKAPGEERGLFMERGLAMTPELLKSLDDRQSGAWARSPSGEPVYLNTENGRLYAYTERAGFNCVRQDFWRELYMSAEQEGLYYAGKQFKRNVGYGMPEGDMTPYVRLNVRQLEFIRGQLISQHA